eukprot:5668393-Prymnesium_polylepis.1
MAQEWLTPNLARIVFTGLTRLHKTKNQSPTHNDHTIRTVRVRLVMQKTPSRGAERGDGERRAGASVRLPP